MLKQSKIWGKIKVKFKVWIAVKCQSKVRFYSRVMFKVWETA